MTAPAISYAAQADAVELAYVNLKGHCDILENLVAQRKRPQIELDQQRARLPTLQAAVLTMREVERRVAAREAAKQGAA